MKKKGLMLPVICNGNHVKNVGMFNKKSRQHKMRFLGHSKKSLLKQKSLNLPNLAKQINGC